MSGYLETEILLKEVNFYEPTSRWTAVVCWLNPILSPHLPSPDPQDGYQERDIEITREKADELQGWVGNPVTVTFYEDRGIVIERKS